MVLIMQTLAFIKLFAYSLEITRSDLQCMLSINSWLMIQFKNVCEICVEARLETDNSWADNCAYCDIAASCVSVSAEVMYIQ
jgi:hypothetical protein